MKFDSKGVLIGFSEPVVHSYNKGVTALTKINHLNEKLQVSTMYMYIVYSHNSNTQFPNILIHDI